jgi:hypothetical protein
LYYIQPPSSFFNLLPLTVVSYPKTQSVMPSCSPIL